MDAYLNRVHPFQFFVEMIYKCLFIKILQRKFDLCFDLFVFTFLY